MVPFIPTVDDEARRGSRRRATPVVPPRSLRARLSPMEIAFACHLDDELGRALLEGDRDRARALARDLLAVDAERAVPYTSLILDD